MVKINTKFDLELSKQRLRYTWVLYALAVIILSFYILKYNFSHKIYDYNFIFFPLMAIYLTLPVIYWKTKNINLFGILSISIPSILLGILLYSSGGTMAPGIFWLSALPITGGVILGKRGTYLGIFYMLAIVFIFVVLENIMTLPNIIADKNIYVQEKRVNAVLFFIYNAIIPLYFISQEYRSRQSIYRQKDMIENLLRILIHDVASPLTIVNFDVRIIKKVAEDEKIKNLSLGIETQLKNISQILEQIRYMKSIQDGKLDLKFQQVNVHKIMQETIELIQSKGKLKEIEFEIINNSKEEDIITADPVILKNQILMNLLSNALKFSMPGSKITLTCQSEAENIVIKVKDRGIGIPQEILETLFDFNTQTSRRGTSNEAGTGYGMPIVKEFVSHFNGTIDVYSIEKKPHQTSMDQTEHGTEFTIKFPKVAA